jgi:hypothetical protein
MPRPAILLLLPLLLAACTAPLGTPPVGGAPRGERDARYEACRAEATRVVQWRERGQTMRSDETENSRGTVTVAPYARAESDRAMAQIDRDRMIADCLRSSETGGTR